MTQKYLSTVARGDDDKSSPTGNNFLTLSLLDLILTSIYSERHANVRQDSLILSLEHKSMYL